MKVRAKTKSTLKLAIFNRMTNSHQVTFTVYSQGKYRSGQPFDEHKANKIVAALKKALPDKKPLSEEALRKKEIKLKPYDIILFVNFAGLPMYSAMIARAEPEVYVAELKDPRGIKFIPVLEAIKNRKPLVPYLFRSDEVDAVIRKKL